MTYVFFERAGGDWSQQAKLVPAEGDSDDEFGQLVAMAVLMPCFSRTASTSSSSFSERTWLDRGGYRDSDLGIL